MDFLELIDQVRDVLRSRSRITYRTLKRQFALDDETLEDLKFELIEGQRTAVDEDGKVLVWTGEQPVGSSQHSVASREKEDRQRSQVANPRSSIPDPRPPVSYTPTHLAERIRAEQAALEARGATDGERKTITALFADLKGSTALIEGLDPEEARAIIDPALQLMMDAVHRYEGYVAQVLGDGIFALFGAPIAHEDHPQRALYAALRMQEEVRRYADTLRRKGYPPLLMRVGLNTGEVVVRSIRKDDLHTDYVPVGHATNLAARMEQLATPGAIFVTAHTHKLADGYFAFKDLGPTQIKGVEAPLSVYEVLGVGPLRTRLQVAARRGLTRFVGRHGEMAQLQRALERAKTGRGQIVGVMGEPGLGKSRLFHEFKLLFLSGCLMLEAFPVSHGKASPYLPIIELLKDYFQIEPTDDERTRRTKVTGNVLSLDKSLEDALPYFFSLLGIEDSGSSLQQMDPQVRRRRTFEALKKLFLRESLNQPLILIFEDLHWIDSETQGFLDILSESLTSARILLLVNYRPEYRHEWGQKTYYTQLQLTPFDKGEAGEFLDALLGATVGMKPASPLQDLKQLILEKTDGAPFFMEEIVQELVEQGVLVREAENVRRDAPLPTDLRLPPTVQGILAARIDRLAPDEKVLLQQLSVIGREFSFGLVRQVVQQSEDELYRLLSALQRKEFLYEQPAFPEVAYLFKHALTHEVAYSTVLQERRRTLHERTAQTIETFYQDNLDEHFSELAHHYSQSNNAKKAVEYLGRAGQQAVQRSANAEAVKYLRAALDLLQTLPDTPHRPQQELTLQIVLGAALIVTRGWTDPEVEQVYSRARKLCRQGGETKRLFPVLFGLWLYYMVQAEYQTAAALGQELLNLAEQEQDAELFLQAHHALGLTFFCYGKFDTARRHLEQVEIIYKLTQDHSLDFLYGGHDPGMCCRGLEAMTHWPLGHVDLARRRAQESYALANQLSHPMSLAVVLQWVATFYQFCREERSVQQHAKTLVDLCSAQGLPQLGWGKFLRGWALAEQEKREEGLMLMREGAATLQDAGEKFLQSYRLALLAEAYGGVGQAADGLTVASEALLLVEKSDERFYEAELYRIKGELLLTQAGKLKE